MYNHKKNKKNDLPFLPFLLSIEEKMSKKINTFFLIFLKKMRPLCSQ